MLSGALELGTVGLIAATVCLGAYIYAFIWKPVGGRWLQILGLISTLLALVLLSCDLRVGEALGATLNRVAAEGFLVVAAVTQSFAALRRRRGDRRREAPAAVEAAEVSAQPVSATAA